MTDTRERTEGADAAPLQPAAGRATGVAERVPGTEGATVLVVDDTEGNRYTVSRLLRGAGMSVSEAVSATEAYQRLGEQAPDLVVLDINLPDQSGHEVLEAIRANPATAAIPVMHVTASYTSNSDRAYGLEHGADAYLTHPLDPDVFVATVRALLRAEGERALRYRTEHQARRAAEAATSRATLLQDLTAALARTMSADEVGRVVLTRAFEGLGAAVGMLAATSADGTELRTLGVANIPADLSETWQAFPVARRSPLSDAVRSVAPVSLGTRDEMVDRYPDAEGAVLERLTVFPRSLYATPLVVDRGPGQRVLGAVGFMWTRERAIGPDEQSLIGAVADQCALALERARLYEAERAARAAAEDASRAKTELLSTLSHELRTPLNSVRGHLGLLEADVYGVLTDTQRAALGRAQRSAVYLTSLINDLLNFSRLESGQVEFEVEDVPIGGPTSVLREIEALVATQAAAKGISVGVPETAPADGAYPCVRADADKVRIILANLVTNAIKFTDPGGRVTLEVEDDAAAGVGRVRVSDTGRGIPAEQLERIFEPFVQVDRSQTHESQQGVGLGLAISRTLARGMGGDLTVESAPGTGTVMTLTLRRATPPPLEDPAAPSPGGEPA